MNLPNKLTMIRLALVPVFIVVCLLPELTHATYPTMSFLGTSVTIIDLIAFAVFALASITDFFDGKIARSQNLITTFGKFMDPVADKMLVNSALILMTYQNRMSIVCLLVMILRDTFVDAIRFMAASRNIVIAASWYGKAKTFTQMVALCLILLNNPIFAAMGIPMDQIFIIAATVISALSGLDYFNQNKSYILESM